jgi:hypothetical protein
LEFEGSKDSQNHIVLYRKRIEIIQHYNYLLLLKMI